VARATGGDEFEDSAMHIGIGQLFAAALAKKDTAALLDILDSEVDFRGLTPGRFWETGSAQALVDDILLGAWFEADDHIDSLESVELGSVADRARRLLPAPGQQSGWGLPGRTTGLLRGRERSHQLADDPVLGLPGDRRDPALNPFLH
jgi:hypothetical protein